MIVLPLLSTLLQELGKLLLLNIDIVVLAGCSQVLLRIILELGVYYGSIECDELHVVLGAAALWVPRERLIAGEALQEILQIVVQYLHSVWVGSANLLGLGGEVLVNDAWVSATLNVSTKDWEQVVTEGQVVTSLGALPFANRWLFLSFDTSSFLMTLIVNKVAMCNCRVSLCLRSAAFAVPVFKA